MKRRCQIVVGFTVLLTTMPALAEIDSAKLIGEWCLVSRTLNGHDLATIAPTGFLNKQLKTKPGQQYHFQDTETVDVVMVDKTTRTFAYSFKKDAIAIRKWERFSVKSITESEVIATVYGTVKHRFTLGSCP